MLLAGIAIVPPAIARIVIAFQLPEPIIFLGYLLLILSLIMHDVRRDRKSLRFSLLCGLFIFVSVIAAVAIGSTEMWSAFLAKSWG